MIPALIVPVLARPELLYRMVRSIDHKVEHLVIIDNGGCVETSQVGGNEHVAETSVIRLPANLGVAGSWNLGIKVRPFAHWWLVANFDITWLPGSLAAFEQEARTSALVLSGAAPPWCAFAIGEEVVQAVGLFDERLHPAYFEDNDMQRRCDAHGFTVVNSSIRVHHDNSSTLAAGFQSRNQQTFHENRLYYERKASMQDFTEGRWSLAVRRMNSWD